MAAAPTSGRLTATARGGGDPIVLPVSDPAVSWAVSDVPLLSAVLSLDAYLGSGLDATDAAGWMNRELSWDHPTLGPWSGPLVVVNRLTDRVELVGEGWVSRLKDRRTVPLYRPVAGPAGALAYRAVVDAATDDASDFASIEVDMDGPSLTAEWRDDNLYQVFGRLAADAGMDFWCDETRNLRFRVRVGRDLTGEVRLVRGIHLVDVRAPVDRGTVVNDLVGVSSEGDYGRSARARAEDLGSVHAHGRRQAAAQFPGTTVGAVKWRTETEVARRARPATPAEIVVADVDRCWSWFREGDTVRLSARSLGSDRAFRVYTRAWSAASGRLVCVGDLTALEGAA